MAHVITDGGIDLGDVTDAGQLAYYRREPGFTVDGDVVPAPDPAPTVLEVTPDTTGTGGVEGGPQRPADDAHKPEWVAYAKTVDPGNAETIDGSTKADLIAAYGGSE